MSRPHRPFDSTAIPAGRQRQRLLQHLKLALEERGAHLPLVQRTLGPRGGRPAGIDTGDDLVMIWGEGPVFGIVLASGRRLGLADPEGIAAVADELAAAASGSEPPASPALEMSIGESA